MVSGTNAIQQAYSTKRLADLGNGDAACPIFRQPWRFAGYGSNDPGNAPAG